MLLDLVERVDERLESGEVTHELEDTHDAHDPNEPDDLPGLAHDLKVLKKRTRFQLVETFSLWFALVVGSTNVEKHTELLLSAAGRMERQGKEKRGREEKDGGWRRFKPF